MKTLAAVFVSVLTLTGTTTPIQGADFRTDINPALLYYQAFTVAPNLAHDDDEYLGAVGTDGWSVPQRAGKLLAQYDDEFKLVRQAAQAAVPCDWGIDWSAGPGTLLPELARCKAVAVKSRLCARWDLQNGRQAEACDDLLAALVLARNTGRNQAVIGVLVEIAMEAIVCNAVAENYSMWSPESVNRLLTGLAAAPARGTLAAGVGQEEISSSGFLKDKVRELRAQYPGNEAKVMGGIHEIFKTAREDEGAAEKLWEQIMAASGGTSEGLLKLAEDMKPAFRRFAEIMALPQPEYERELSPFIAQVQASTNPFAALSIPAIAKSRPKEFRIEAQLAMVRAALEYKLHGDVGLRSVADPFGKGPFGFKRFVFQGTDRGFELSSAYVSTDFPWMMIFVERDGAPFQVWGSKAGEALPGKDSR